MRILGLDPSLSGYGWAVHETEAQGEARCSARGRVKSPSSMVFVDRYTGAREILRQLIRTYQPDAVGVESPFFGGSYSEGMYGLFLYTNEALRLEHRDVVYFSPLQVKAHARESLGRPEGWKMMKPDMVAAAKKDAAIKRALDNNEADAYQVARLAGRFWTVFHHPGLDLTPVERNLFTREHTFVRGKKAGETEQTGLFFREDDRFFVWSRSGLDQEPVPPTLIVSHPTPPKAGKK